MTRKHSCKIIFVILLLFSSASVFAQQNKEKEKQPDREAQKTDDKIRLSTDLVSVTVSVTDSMNRMVTGFQKEDFEIYDDNVRQEVAFFSNEDAPITLGIIYDISGSMTDLTSRSFQALRQFFETSHEDDEYFVIAFNSKANLVQDFTISPDDILNRVIFVKAGGNTALYDATYLAVEKVRQGRHKRKALLIISDGIENNSRYSFKEVSTHLKESDAQIFAIALGDAGGGALRSLADLSGGQTFMAGDHRAMSDLYMRLALMLRHQYVLGFYPTNTTSGSKWHKLRIKVRTPKRLGRVALYYKEGYQSFR